MPIDTQSALLRLNPLTPLSSLGGSDQLDMERQRLDLLRQEFEETKRKNLQDEEYKKLAEAAATKRVQLENERATERAKAEAAAKNLEARQAALAEVGARYNARDFGGMQVAAERLNQLGGYARRIDAGGPFPAYQLDLEPPKTPAGLNPMDALGYGTLGTPDSLSETDKGAAPALSTEEAFRQAGSVPTDQAPAAPTGGDPTTETPDALTSENLQPGGAATDQYGPPTAPPANPIPAPSAAVQGLTPGATSFAPRMAAEAPDMTGGVTNDVPQDVINTAGLQYEQAQRLGPVMAGIAQAYPESYRNHIQQAGDAIVAGGFSPEKTMELAQAARTEVGGAVEKEQAHQFKLDEEAAKAAAEEKDPIKVQRRIDYGAKRAKTAFDEKAMKLRIGVVEAANDVEKLLSDDDHNNDEKAINLLMKLDAQVGAQSDKDAGRVTGEQKAAFSTRIQQWAHQFFVGGYDPELSKSMLTFAQSLKERQRGEMHDYIEEMYKQGDANQDPLVGKGYRDFVTGVMPRSVLDEYDQEAGDTPEQQSKGGEPSSGGGALESMAAEHGYDAGAIRRVVGGESKGDPQAASPNSSAKGLWQALDSTAQRYVNPRTGQKFADSKELAQLSPEEQYQVLAQYLQESGVTEKSPPEDYALAIAAPAFVGKGAHEDMVVYPKGSDKWKANKPWRPADDGDITVGSIINYYFGNKKQSGEKPKAGKGADNAKALEGL